METLDKILVVEDDSEASYILNRLLTKSNYEVKFGQNGLEALEILKTFKPKVILADWNMPVMDGLQLCNYVKLNEEFKSIYFIILTARGTLKDRVQGLDVGADDFLVKPMENQELLARIRAGVRIFNLQNELRKIEHSKALITMAATTGHKINNPLSSLIFSIKNLEQLLAEKKIKDADEDLFVINESIERIKGFINDLINLEVPEIVNYASDSNMLKMD
ncbi:MAG: hypothetical protein C0425_01990 [Chlorobiaceae bacterium]|nr:hypothetical protein [Chlorobiaceae bacterium]MBA4309089.1 hypothetical protein [Chlorobiaceae bacterium]